MKKINSALISVFNKDGIDDLCIELHKNDININKVKNSTIYLFVLQDTNPIYSFEKATTCWQVLNKTMKTLKENMRLKIGGSVRSTGTIHGSYNPEEAFCVLKPLKLLKYTQRKTFQDFNDFFTSGLSRGRNMPLLATRGCPFQCTFCSSPSMWTTRYVMRDPKEIVDEIEWLMKEYKANDFEFFDLTAIIKKSWILDWFY